MIVNVRLNPKHFRADSSDLNIKQIGFIHRTGIFRVFKSSFPQKKAKSFFCGKFFESFYTIFTVGVRHLFCMTLFRVVVDTGQLFCLTFTVC